MADETAHYAEKVGDTQQKLIAQSAGSVEYSDCFPNNECPG